MAMSEDQFNKVRNYLVENGQQELIGHLDGMWQELNQLRSQAESPDQDHVSAQDFQDQASSEGDEQSTPEQPTESSSPS